MHSVSRVEFTTVKTAVAILRGECKWGVDALAGKVARELARR
jgi:hypothetical protein